VLSILEKVYNRTETSKSNKSKKSTTSKKSSKKEDKKEEDKKEEIPEDPLPTGKSGKSSEAATGAAIGGVEPTIKEKGWFTR